MNLQHKEYNPCGDLTGRERDICNAALNSYFNLPFAQVIRNIAIQEITNIDMNFKNEQAIINWADYNLNDVERGAAIDFSNFNTVQVGLYKYILHLLFENRYNIEYNRLVNYCQNLDADVIKNVNLDALERKINAIAQETNYNATFDDMTAELENFIRS